MAVTLEEITQRVERLERDLHELKRGRASGVSVARTEETPAQRGARLLHQAKENQAQISAGIEEAFDAMGIVGEPIGAENVQKMVAACGFRPEDNAFSRGIIEMREE